jgi:ABC-2 type transport system permease protein
MSKLLKTEQLRHLTIAYSMELLREPGVLFWGIIFPILMSLGLGIAFTKKQDIERHVAIVSNSRSENTEIVAFILNAGEKIEGQDGNMEYKVMLRDENMGNTTLYFESMPWEEAIARLKRGTLGLIVEEKDGEKIYHFDPSNTDAQLTYMKI